MFDQNTLLYLVALLPVVLFVGALVTLDSFSLIKYRSLGASFAWGALCVWLVSQLPPDLYYAFPVEVMRAPIFEELLKGVGVLVVVRLGRSAFFVDAVIYGAAIGAGFAFFENIRYLSLYPDMLLGTAVLRGVGTAAMHCGAVMTTAALLSWLRMRRKRVGVWFLPALLPAMVIHALFNLFVVPPVVQLPVVLLGVGGWVVLLILYNDYYIASWLEREMLSEVELIKAIERGEFGSTYHGAYLLSIRERFEPEHFLDMWCYVTLYLKLSLHSKRNLMLHKAGLEVPRDEEVKWSLEEFKALGKRIPKVGMIALAPIVKRDRLLKWKLRSIK